MRQSILSFSLVGVGLAALFAQPAPAQQTPGYADLVRVALSDEDGVVRAYMTYKQNLGTGPTVIVFTDAQGKRLNAIGPQREHPTPPPAPPPPARPAANPLAGPALPAVVLPPAPRPPASCERCDDHSDITMLDRRIVALKVDLQRVVDRLNAARVK
jgi:hypothetical protein